MTLHEQKRLAQIRAQWQAWSAVTNTSEWEVTFFFQVLEAKNREIDYWKNRANAPVPQR